MVRRRRCRRNRRHRATDTAPRSRVRCPRRWSNRRAGCVGLGAGRECPAVEDELGYLQSIERRALAEVVVHGPQCELVRIRASADPADEDLITACGRSGGREVFERDVRRRAEYRPRLVWRQWLLGFDPDRLSVSYEDWDSDAGGLDCEVGQAEDLLRLGPE